MRQVYGSREPRSAFLHCTPCLSGTSELPTSPSPHQCGGEGRQAGMTEGRNQGGSKPGLPFRFKPSKPHPGVRQGPGSPQGARSRVLGGVSKSTAPWSHLGLLTCKTQRSHGRGPDRAAPPVGAHLSPLLRQLLLAPPSSGHLLRPSKRPGGCGAQLISPHGRALCTLHQCAQDRSERRAKEIQWLEGLLAWEGVLPRPPLPHAHAHVCAAGRPLCHPRRP